MNDDDKQHCENNIYMQTIQWPATLTITKRDNHNR